MAGGHAGEPFEPAQPLPPLRRLLEQRPERLSQVARPPALRQRRRDRAHGVGRAAERLQREAERGQLRDGRFQRLRLRRGQVQRQRLQQQLRVRLGPLGGRQQLVEQDALVRGVLVDQEDPLRPLGDDVRRCHLAQHPQRRQPRGRRRRGRCALLPLRMDRRLVPRRARLRPRRALERRRRQAVALRERGDTGADAVPVERRWRERRRRGGGDVRRLVTGAEPRLGRDLGEDARRAGQAEVGDRRPPEMQHRGARRPADRAPDRPLVEEADLALGRVDVDIDRLRRQGDVHHRDRVPPDHQQAVVGLLQREAERAVLHPAPVDEEGDPLPVRPVQGRRADVTRDGDPRHVRRVRVERQHLPGDLRAVDPDDRVEAVARAIGRQRPPPLDDQLEAHRRPRQRVGGDDPPDHPVLGRRGAQELQPRRHVGEEVAHRDRRPDRAGDRAGRAPLRPVPDDLVATRGVRGPAGDRHARDRRQRAKRLAPEAERGDPLEVLRRAQLAGGVLPQGQVQLVARDATAVVGHLQQLAPARAHLHADLPRPRVERVLEQLLHRRGRPLDYLAGRDLAHQFGGEQGNRHRAGWSFRGMSTYILATG